MSALPNLLFPPSGVQAITRLAGLVAGRRDTCPINLSLDQQTTLWVNLAQVFLTLPTTS